MASALPMLAIQNPIWAGIAVCPTHFAVSMLSQLAQMDLSMSHELSLSHEQARRNPRKSHGMNGLGAC